MLSKKSSPFDEILDSLGQKVFLHFGVYSMLSKKSSSFWAKLLKFYHKISVGQD